MPAAWRVAPRGRHDHGAPIGTGFSALIFCFFCIKAKEGEVKRGFDKLSHQQAQLRQAQPWQVRSNKALQTHSFKFL
jgi:hypothetical protein